MKRFILSSFALILTALLLPGCSGAKKPLARKPDFHEGMHVFNRSCARCHDQPDSEAPQLDDPGDWDIRALQWRSILKRHIADGYLDMPAQTGRPGLTEQAIDDALYFMEIKLKSLED